jgi:hypothetical protein
LTQSVPTTYPSSRSNTSPDRARRRLALVVVVVLIVMVVAAIVLGLALVSARG